MITLSHLAVDDDDLQDSSRHLPLERVELKHLNFEAIHQARHHEIVVLYRADGQQTLKNTYQEEA